MLLRSLSLAALAISAAAVTSTPSDARTVQLIRPGSRVMLNPQPLPPRWIFVNPATRVGLNPQPLPPRAIYRYRHGRR